MKNLQLFTLERSCFPVVGLLMSTEMLDLKGLRFSDKQASHQHVDLL